MLSNQSDIRNEFLIRLQGSTAIAFYTDAIINNWLEQAHQKAAGLHKWPFTEGRVSTTWTSSTEEWSFEGYRADSFRLVQIGGKRFRKTNFEDYQIYREESSSGKDKVFSDFGSLVFINPNADVSGTLTAWGQFIPILDLTDTTANTVFTSYAPEGNEAIVELMLSYAKTREKKLDEGREHLKNALEILEAIWANIAGEQYAYQQHAQRDGMWKRVDILRGGFREDTLKKNQWS